MADWQRTLRLQPEWGKAKLKEISLQTLAGSIAAKLKALRPFGDENVEETREDLILGFESLAKSQRPVEVDEFDDLMDELYDWGDIKLSGQFFDAKKVCWIDQWSKP